MTSQTASPDIATSALRVFLAAALVLGALAAGWGALLVAWDLASHQDEWDGFGVIIGLIVGLPGLLMTGLAGIALRNGRRRPATARSLALVLGALVALSLFFLPLSNPVVSVPAAVLAAGLLGSAVLPANGGRA